MPAFPLPIELVATTENMYLVIGLKLVIVQLLVVISVLVRFGEQVTSLEYDTV